MSKIKKQLFEQLALIAHSLGSPQRVEMLDYLAQAERSVDELSQLCDLSIANTSRHLQILKQHGLVSMRKQGKSRLYTIAGDDVVQLVSSLRHTAENHLAQVNVLKSQMKNSKNKQQVISSQELYNKLKHEDTLIFDVRPEKEYLQGHIKGAINILPNKIEQKTQELSTDKTIVAYCRGPYCLYSYQMLESLQSKGIKALRLEDGFPEWKAAGLPYEV